MLTALLLTALAADPGCPNYTVAIGRAEDALRARDLMAVEDAVTQAEEGFRCGPIFEDRKLRARFWLVQAVLLDMQRDTLTSDAALRAAWRSWSEPPLDVLPSHLRKRFTELAAAPSEDITFALSPLPATNSVLYIDGAAAYVIKPELTGDLDETIHTTSGLHIFQLTVDVMASNATAARIANMTPGASSALDVFDRSLFSRRRTSFAFSAEQQSGPQGGCAHGKASR